MKKPWRIAFTDIVYAESQNQYQSLHLADGEEVLTRMKLIELYESIGAFSDENVVFENGLPKSKGGIGVTSVLHSAAQYGGESDFRNEVGMFTFQLLLKIPEKAKLQV